MELHTVEADPKAIALCSVKAARADLLTLEEAGDLAHWAGCQTCDLWDSMNLQEILNVYRASAAWGTWEDWAAVDWRAAYAAWDGAVIDPGNRMQPRAA